MPDYVVVGSGIVGLSTAFHIKRLDPGASVVVIDRNPGPGGGDTGRSAAAFRAFFTSRVNVMLAGSSIEYYRSVQESGFDLGMRMVGYLFMADRGLMERVGEAIRRADSLGLEYRVYDPGELESLLGARTRVSGMEEAEILGVGDIEAGVLAVKAGILAAEKLVDYYYRSCLSLGVEFSFNTEVRRLLLAPRRPLGVEGEPFPWQDSRVYGVETDRGVVEAGRKVIVAAGVWANRILNPVGVDSYSRPKKRQVFSIRAVDGLGRVLRARGFNDEGISPMIILPRGAYARPAPEEESFWVGISDELGRRIGVEEPPVAEEEFYTYGVYPILSLYLPPFTDKTPTSSWAGHYDTSMDGLPVIFEPWDSDLIVSGGTSGSGIMKADAIGRITAGLALGMEHVELYTGEEFRVSWLGLKGRISEEEKLVI